MKIPENPPFQLEVWRQITLAHCLLCTCFSFFWSWSVLRLTVISLVIKKLSGTGKANAGLERKLTGHSFSSWWHPLRCSRTVLHGEDCLATTWRYPQQLLLYHLPPPSLSFDKTGISSDKNKEVLLPKSLPSIKIIHFEQLLFVSKHRNIFNWSGKITIPLGST